MNAGGRIYRTVNALTRTPNAQSWSIVGQPNQLDGSQAKALAFGAYDPADPVQNGSKNNFFYAGTQSGNVFVTRNGGTTWTNISAGLDGSAVHTIQANPTRGKYDLYAITDQGIYYKADSRTATAWVNVTGNLKTLSTQVFGNAATVETVLKPNGKLNVLVADWSSLVPNVSGNPGAGSHPVLYVGGEGGVFRSRDASGTGAATWTIFPNADDGAAQDGGLLPRINVTDLAISAAASTPIRAPTTPAPR